PDVQFETRTNSNSIGSSSMFVSSVIEVSEFVVAISFRSSESDRSFGSVASSTPLIRVVLFVGLSLLVKANPVVVGRFTTGAFPLVSDSVTHVDYLGRSFQCH